MKRSFIRALLALGALSVVLFASCKNASDDNSLYLLLAQSMSQNSTALFSDYEVSQQMENANSITLSDGMWTYACSLIINNNTVTPVKANSLITLEVSDNSTTVHRRSFSLEISKDVPAGVNAQEVVNDAKKMNYLYGLYIKGADVTLVGNTVKIKKTYTTAELRSMDNSQNTSTEIFNDLFYKRYPSTVLTNADRTKYKITTSASEGTESAQVTVWIKKQ